VAPWLGRLGRLVGWAGLAFEQRVDVFDSSQARSAQEGRRGDAKKPSPDQQLGSDNQLMRFSKPAKKQIRVRGRDSAVQHSTANIQKPLRRKGAGSIPLCLSLSLSLSPGSTG